MNIQFTHVFFKTSTYFRLVNNNNIADKIISASAVLCLSAMGYNYCVE